MATKSKSPLSARGREMYTLIERYLSSGLAQQAFCEEAGIVFTTFQYWLYRYRADKGPKAGRGQLSVRNAEGRGRSGFVALGPDDPEQSPVTRYDCELELPGGVILRLCKRPDGAWLSDVASSVAEAR